MPQTDSHLMRHTPANLFPLCAVAVPAFGTSRGAPRNTWTPSPAWLSPAWSHAIRRSAAVLASRAGATLLQYLQRVLYRLAEQRALVRASPAWKKVFFYREFRVPRPMRRLSQSRPFARHRKQVAVPQILVMEKNAFMAASLATLPPRQRGLLRASGRRCPALRVPMTASGCGAPCGPGSTRHRRRAGSSPRRGEGGSVAASPGYLRALREALRQPGLVADARRRSRPAWAARGAWFAHRYAGMARLMVTSPKHWATVFPVAPVWRVAPPNLFCPSQHGSHLRWQSAGMPRPGAVLDIMEKRRQRSGQLPGRSACWPLRQALGVTPRRRPSEAWARWLGSS